MAKAIVKFPEVILESLAANDLKPTDINLLIPYQANLRIAQFVQQKLQLSDDKVYNNIKKYCSIHPHCIMRSMGNGKIKEGDLVYLAAFGSCLLRSVRCCVGNTVFIFS